MLGGIVLAKFAAGVVLIAPAPGVPVGNVGPGFPVPNGSPPGEFVRSLFGVGRNAPFVGCVSVIPYHGS
jgi:hypothetical protein